MWQQWTNIILGLWIALIPFLGFFGESKAITLTLMLSGAVIVLTSAWSIITRDDETETTNREFHNSPLW